MVRLYTIFSIITVFPFLCSTGVWGQERVEEPEYSTRVRLVELTLQATDAGGRHVTDLQPEELSIIAGGKEREIRVFEPVAIGLERFGALKTLGVEYRDLLQDEQSPPYRYYLLLFNQVQFQIGAMQRAKEAAARFIRGHMLANDRVAVTFFDKRVDMELDFTGDKDKVLETIESMALKHRNIKWNDDFYSYLKLIADRATRIPYRVAVILIAEGMLGVGSSGGQDAYDDAVAALQAADVRVFGIDVGGLNLKDPGASVARLSPQVSDKIRQSFNLGFYTQPTGGRYFRYHNDIDALFEQVDYEMSAYYVIGFYLDEDEPSQDSLSLDVRVSRPGVRLLYKNRFRPGLSENPDN